MNTKRAREDDDDGNRGIRPVSDREIVTSHAICKKLRELNTFDDVSIMFLEGAVKENIVATGSRTLYLHFTFDHRRTVEESVCKMMIAGPTFKYTFRARIDQICAKRGLVLKTKANKDEYDEVDFSDLKLVAIYENKKQTFEPRQKKGRLILDAPNYNGDDEVESVDPSLSSRGSEIHVPAKIFKVDQDDGRLNDVVKTLQERWEPAVKDSIRDSLMANEEYMKSVRQSIRDEIFQKEGDEIRASVVEEIEKDARRLHIDTDKPLSEQERFVIANIVAKTFNK